MEFGNDQAIYLQIADYFCENILLEKWKVGDRIPSVREIAVNIEVNPNTVMRTFTYLQDKGIIFNKRGIGYFVSEDGFEKTKALRKQDFVNQELPRFFKAMTLLNFTMEDVNAYYREYEKRQSNGLNDEAR
jgi:DNA-binding transcriptional regulator YhcF (GntR family)